MKRPRWLRADVKPRLREEKVIFPFDNNEPRKSHGAYRQRPESLREVMVDPKIKEAEIRHGEANPRFRKEPIKIDEKSIVRHSKTKPHLRQEKPVVAEKEIRGKEPKFDAEQYAKHAEINRRLMAMRRPKQNKA